MVIIYINYRDGVKFQLSHTPSLCRMPTFCCLDTEALLSLGQHQLNEGSRTLGREVRGRRRLKVSKYLLLKHLKRPRSTLQLEIFNRQQIIII